MCVWLMQRPARGYNITVYHTMHEEVSFHLDVATAYPAK